MDLTQDTPSAGSGIIPGTVHLVDLDHDMQTLHAGTNDIVLVPTPSTDVNDPLNWTPRRKMMSTICVNVYIVPQQSVRRPLLTFALGIPGLRECLPRLYTLFWSLCHIAMECPYLHW